jgi:hypothetical protein
LCRAAVNLKDRLAAATARAAKAEQQGAKEMGARVEYYAEVMNLAVTHFEDAADDAEKAAVDAAEKAAAANDVDKGVLETALAAAQRLAEERRENLRRITMSRDEDKAAWAKDVLLAAERAADAESASAATGEKLKAEIWCVRACVCVSSSACVRMCMRFCPESGLGRMLACALYHRVTGRSECQCVC